MKAGGSGVSSPRFIACAFLAVAVAACSSPAPEIRPAATPTISAEERQALMDGQIASLRMEIERLDGQVAAVSRERDELRRRQAMLEERIDSLEAPPAPAPTEPEPSPTRTPTPHSPTPTPTPEPTPLIVPARELYQMGLEAFQKAEYQKAVLLFQEYLVNYRSTDLADNSQYWIGECHYVQGDYNRALASFESVVANYPRGNKVPAAMLKIALTYQRLGQKEKAAKGFRELMERHPKSPEARIARDTLGKAQ